jgi:DNA-binding beta-propeller fold protein YncE
MARFCRLLLVITFAPSLLPAQSRVDRTAYAQARDSAYARPINHSSIAFTLPEKDLLPENLGYDPADGSFYIGSTRKGKVVRRAANGRVSDFIPTGRDGLWMVVGLKVDSGRRILWVNSSGASNYFRYTPADDGKAGLFRYDLESGRLLKKFLPKERGPHFFNDLVITRDGRVFVTDMAGKAIYLVSPSADSLVRWVAPENFTDPNGIALSADERTLYVATVEGLNSIDIATRTKTLLPHPPDVDDVGIDGLYFLNGSLIGIQGGRRNIVQRFVLKPDRTRIERAEVLEANHPMFMNPTTGVIVGRDLYYIANSQFGSFDKNGSLFPPERLFEPVILRLTP